MHADENPFAESDALARAKLTTETAKIEWRALQRFFAAGKAIAVAEHLDLVEVAFVISIDDRARLEQWTRSGEVGPVSDALARQWIDADATVWAVVVRPWVLVQAERR